jgi:ribosomal protein S18 acetylase RimI-like enzyme
MSRSSNRAHRNLSTHAETATVEPATVLDAGVIARLINLAGEGIPYAIWRCYASAEQDPLAFGAERAAIGSGNFSWRNVQLLKDSSGIAGMLLAYRLPDTTPDFSDIHPLEYPLVKLEAMVPGSSYINALAVRPKAQRQGYGRHLMEQAHRSAVFAGCESTALIVFAHNTKACALYRSLGYIELARQPPIDHPVFSALGECLLLVRNCQ